MQIKRRINEDKWAISIISDKEMKKVSGNKTTAGLCVAYEKIIYLREDSIDYATIAHELFHAYWSYLFLSDTNNIKLDDAEEIAATFFAAKGEIMIKKAKAITRDLQKLTKGNDNE